MSFGISVTVDVSGIEKILSNLVIVPPEIGRMIGGYVASEARVLAPYEFGALMSSIEEDYPGGNVLARINVWQDYGVYQELGFHHYRSGAFIQNPFLLPAVEHWAPVFTSPATWQRIFDV